MANIKGKASLNDLLEWLHLIDLGREKLVSAIDLAKKHEIQQLENVPDTYENAAKAVRTGAASILAAAIDLEVTGEIGRLLYPEKAKNAEKNRAEK